jgi:hypothetical protein
MRKNAQALPHALSAAITLLRRYSDFTANAGKRDGPSPLGMARSHLWVFFWPPPLAPHPARFAAQYVIPSQIASDARGERRP